MVTETYNHEDIYDKEISPLIKQIINICNTHKIPMTSLLSYQHIDGKGLGRCRTALNDREYRMVQMC